MYHLTKQLRWNAFSTLHFCHLKVKLGQRCASIWWIGVIVRDMHSMNGSKLATKNDFIRIESTFPYIALVDDNLIMKFTQSWTYGVCSMEQRAIRYSTMKNIITMAKCSPHLIKTMITTVCTRLTLLYSENVVQRPAIVHSTTSRAGGLIRVLQRTWMENTMRVAITAMAYEMGFTGASGRSSVTKNPKIIHHSRLVFFYPILSLWAALSVCWHENPATRFQAHWSEWGSAWGSEWMTSKRRTNFWWSFLCYKLLSINILVKTKWLSILLYIPIPCDDHLSRNSLGSETDIANITFIKANTWFYNGVTISPSDGNRVNIKVWV